MRKGFTIIMLTPATICAEPEIALAVLQDGEDIIIT